jgi:hypothetical protein
VATATVLPGAARDRAAAAQLGQHRQYPMRPGSSRAARGRISAAKGGVREIIRPAMSTRPGK